MTVVARVLKGAEVRERVRNLSMEPCTNGRICYGVPFVPDEDQLVAAASRLRRQFGAEAWFAGVTPMFDGNTSYLVVRVWSGIRHTLPAIFDGFAVRYAPVRRV